MLLDWCVLPVYLSHQPGCLHLHCTQKEQRAGLGATASWPDSPAEGTSVPEKPVSKEALEDTEEEEKKNHFPLQMGQGEMNAQLAGGDP